MRSSKLHALVFALTLAAGSAIAGTPLNASVRPNSDVVISNDGTNLAVASYVIFLRGWSPVMPAALDVPLNSLPTPPNSLLPDVPFFLRWNGGTAEMRKQVTTISNGLSFTHVVTPSVPVDVETAGVNLQFDATQWLGGHAMLDGFHVTLPVEPAMGLFSGVVSRIEIRNQLGKQVTVQFPQPTHVRLQDSRAFIPFFEIQVGGGVRGVWPAGESRGVSLTMTATQSIEPLSNQAFVIQEGPDWVPLQMLGRVTPGSALDWSNPSVQPAGSQGWVIVNPSGQFAFENSPQVGRRFYGANIPEVVPDRQTADEIADQFWRSGFNAARLHYWERRLVRRNPSSPTDFDLETVDRLNYMIFALRQRGVYFTMDLHSSRYPIAAGQLRPFSLTRADYLALLLLDPAAREDYMRFARAVMDIHNPYTGLRWKDDPAIAFIGIANENGINAIEGKMSPAIQAEMDAAWQAAGGSGVWSGGNVEGARFAANLQRQAFQWFRTQLRAHGVKALLTDNSAFNVQGVHALNRELFDFVDHHFYWDHPIYLGPRYLPPARGTDGGQSMVASVGGAMRNQALKRLIGKPFTMTEFAYAGPNRFRAEQGLVFGALASIQQWDGLWRFAYMQAERMAWQVQRMQFFGNQGDPLALAGDRMLVALFLRGDLNERVRPQAHSVNRRDLGSAMLASPVTTNLFRAPIGTRFSDSNLADRSRMWQSFRRLGTSVRIHPQSATMTVTSSRTAGLVTNVNGFAVAGTLSARIRGSRAVVWATAVDGRTLLSSRRLLVAHLTDVQSTDTRFVDATRDVIEEWGRLPHLMRDGQAEISLRLPASRALRVFRLDMAGNRVAEVAALQRGGRVTFNASVRGPQGATMYYEIVR